MAADFTQMLYDKAPQCGDARPQSQLEEIFVEGLFQSVRDNIRVYEGINGQVPPFQLARYAATLCKLNRAQASRSTASTEGH